MPRAYEVAGQLIKNVADATDKLMDLQKKLKDVEEEKQVRGPSTVNNALFVGSTADLQKMLKDMNKDTKPKYLKKRKYGNSVVNIVVPQGSDFTQTFTSKESIGTARDLSGYSVSAVLRKLKKPATSSTAFSAGITSATDGTVTITMV